MKRKIALTLICILLAVSTLTGCSFLQGLIGQVTGTNLEGGTNIAKLLLANKRLDSSLLDNNNIFRNGAETLRALANKVSRPDVKNKQLVGKFEVSGDEAVWSEFDEYNNSLSYFENVTSIIIDTAMRGASLIDEIKRNVNIVDTWIGSDSEKYYLSVDKNSETLCKLDSTELKICKRYTDTDGRTVYELYIEQESVCERVLYIPGERYELTQMLPSVNQELYFVADHSKGYWETFHSTKGGGSYNERYTIMKSDVCYYLDYNLDNNGSVIDVMSADTKTDFFNYNPDGDGLNVTMKFEGFDGIERISAPKSDCDENGNLIGFDNVTVYLENGKTIKIDDTFVGGQVEVWMIRASGLADGYVGEFEVKVYGETNEERWNNFKLFLDETGITCRRSWDTVVSGIKNAEEDAANLVKYYQWNGIVISTEENIRAAVAVEAERIKEIRKLYEDVAEGEVVSRFLAAGSVNYSAVDFASIEKAVWEGVTVENDKISIASASLEINDVSLLEKGKSYSLTFAMVSAESDDMVLLETGESVLYEGGAPFRVGVENLTLYFPELAEGLYTVAAFISTDDGIRVSYGKAVEIASLEQNIVELSGKRIDIEKNEDSTVNIVYSDTENHDVIIETETPLTYADFLDAVCTSAFVYGNPEEDRLEMYTEDGYASVAPESEIGAGLYRIPYILKTGEGVVRGYVYVDYVIGDRLIAEGD